MNQTSVARVEQGLGNYAADQSAGGIALDEVLLGIAVVAFVALMIMEVLRPYRRFAGRVTKSSFVTNTTAFMFNNIILSALSASSLFLVAERYSDHGVLSNLESPALRWLLSFVLLDLAVYAWHYAGHRFEFLWRFHKIHHSDKSFNVTTGFRFHVFDLVLELVFKVLVTIALGVQAEVVLLCEVTRMIFVLFHHANVTIPYERALSTVIITPALHRVHHSRLRAEHDSNYGIVLSLWDQIFRTRKELVPQAIGLDMIEADNFVQLFCLAFITERKLSRLLQMLPRGRQ